MINVYGSQPRAWKIWIFEFGAKFFLSIFHEKDFFQHYALLTLVFSMAFNSDKWRWAQNHRKIEVPFLMSKLPGRACIFRYLAKPSPTWPGLVHPYPWLARRIHSIMPALGSAAPHPMAMGYWGLGIRYGHGLGHESGPGLEIFEFLTLTPVFLIFFYCNVSWSMSIYSLSVRTTPSSRAATVP